MDRHPRCAAPFSACGWQRLRPNPTGVPWAPGYTGSWAWWREPRSPGAGRADADGLRYRCLLLDHDDTTVLPAPRRPALRSGSGPGLAQVKSTETIHWPAHVESVRQLRPDLAPCSLQRWIEVPRAPNENCTGLAQFARLGPTL